MASLLLHCSPAHGLATTSSRRKRIVQCSAGALPSNTGGQTAPKLSRRDLLASTSVATITGAALLPRGAAAGPINPLEIKKAMANRRRKIPESEFTEGPQGLKYYDLQVGKGAEAAKGQRVVVHYDVKWKGITFMTSRQGMGVTGGNPLGFDVGVEAGSAGSTLPGIDLGVRGMRVGGLRRLIVPPNLAYGSRGVGEIPPNANVMVELELLSVKTSALGYQVRLVEG